MEWIPISKTNAEEKDGGAFVSSQHTINMPNIIERGMGKKDRVIEGGVKGMRAKY